MKSYQMKNLHWRCVSAIGAGVLIGGVFALVSIPVNVMPTLLIGLVLGLLMAVSEFTVDA